MGDVGDKTAAQAATTLFTLSTLSTRRRTRHWITACSIAATNRRVAAVASRCHSHTMNSPGVAASERGTADPPTNSSCSHAKPANPACAVHHRQTTHTPQCRRIAMALAGMELPLRLLLRIARRPNRRFVGGSRHGSGPSGTHAAGGVVFPHIRILYQRPCCRRYGAPWVIAAGFTTVVLQNRSHHTHTIFMVIRYKHGGLGHGNEARWFPSVCA